MDAERPKLHLRPLSTRRINVRIARICKNRNCEYCENQWKVLIISAKYYAFRSKTFLCKSMAKCIAFRGFWLYLHYPQYGGSAASPLRRIVQILRNFAKYWWSSSFRKLFARFSQSFLGVLLQKTWIFAAFRQVLAPFLSFRSPAAERFHVLPRPCVFSSCTKVFNFWASRWSWWPGHASNMQIVQTWWPGQMARPNCNVIWESAKM